ncbi:LUD domain-containing protein [Persicirhabdus sediminis]|uniref:LUD domain-containing protein n=1 Tax=Persicirhabdus sediminis TaxID=454144 RepID=A0A8J7MDE8_9BACT|nr:LUD domain-containing protein [Persicirhabdus sediminis]MBK1790567.1 hypothetical protein [Persicirhabdus sediminis]
MSSRTKILARIQQALEPENAPMSNETEQAGIPVIHPANLWSRFAHTFTDKNGVCITNVQALSKILQKNGLTNGYCPAELHPLIASTLTQQDIQINAEFPVNAVGSIDFCIHNAYAACARTGKIVYKHALTSQRLASVTPCVQIAIVRKEDIKQDLSSLAYSRAEKSDIIESLCPADTQNIENPIIANSITQLIIII